MKKTLKLENPGLTKENFKNWITDKSKKSVKYLAGINRPIIPYHVTKLAQALTMMGVIRPIVIANISFIDGKPGWPQEPILPGKGGVIKVKYDTKREGRFEKNVTVTSNSKFSSKKIRIKGEIKLKPQTPAGN